MKLGLIDNVKKLSKYRAQKIIKIACRKNIQSQIIETYLYTRCRQKIFLKRKMGHIHLH